MERGSIRQIGCGYFFPIYESIILFTLMAKMRTLLIHKTLGLYSSKNIQVNRAIMENILGEF